MVTQISVVTLLRRRRRGLARTPSYLAYPFAPETLLFVTNIYRACCHAECIQRIDVSSLCINLLGTGSYLTCRLTVLWFTWEGSVSFFLHFQSQYELPSLLLVYWLFPWACYISQLSLLEPFQRAIEKFSAHEQVNMVSGSLKFPSTCDCLIVC